MRCATMHLPSRFEALRWAQLGDLARAKALLRRAVRGFDAKEVVARARCVVAEAEIAFVSRDLGRPAKALEKARESTARRKQEQLLEEQARAEREAAREAAGMNAEDGKGEMKKKKQGSEKAKRKGRSKAQKEASAKALEKAREAAKVKNALKRAGRS